MLWFSYSFTVGLHSFHTCATVPHSPWPISSHIFSNQLPQWMSSRKTGLGLKILHLIVRHQKFQDIISLHSTFPKYKMCGIRCTLINLCKAASTVTFSFVLMVSENVWELHLVNFSIATFQLQLQFNFYGCIEVINARTVQGIYGKGRWNMTTNLWVNL